MKRRRDGGVGVEREGREVPKSNPGERKEKDYEDICVQSQINIP
jgi:hypothetical protein